MKTILFYSPYMGYTGSEMMIKYIVSNTSKINPVILSGENGLLLSEIPKNIPVYIHSNTNIWKYRVGKILKTLSLPDIAEIQFQKIIKRHHIDLIIVNTLVSEKIIPSLRRYNTSFALYLHELPPMFDILKKEEFEFLIDNAKGIIGCSKIVCQNITLMKNNKTHLFYEGIDTKNIKTSIEIEKKVKSMNYSYIFVMSGQRAFHKGFHTILEIALYLKKYNAALIWLGSPNDYGLNYYIQKVIENQKIDNIILPGLLKGEEYYSWLNSCDAFLLTSLVDPYPLVMLEAAYLQKPIIAFDSGGVSEFVKEGMGKVVPYYYVNDFLDAIKDFIEGKIPVDKELLRSEAEKHDISKRIDKFEEIILQFIK